MIDGRASARNERAVVVGAALVPAVLALAIAACGLSGSAGAQERAASAVRRRAVAVWTATIPEGFPGNVYTWRLKADGRYDEDGRDIASGQAVQPTLSGRWTVEGAQMVLRQDGDSYVFDGIVIGDRYFGTLYLGGRRVSRFCAAKGELPPEHCDAERTARAAGAALTAGSGPSNPGRAARPDRSRRRT